MSDIDTVLKLINEAKRAGIPDGAFTTSQLVERTGRSRDFCARLLRNAIALGLAEWCGDILILNRANKHHSTPHYRFIDQETTKRKGKK